MKCRQFEDAMSTYFCSVDDKEWRTLVIAEKWERLPTSDAVEHLATCPDCVTSLLQYLEIRNTVDYHLEPCFHVAYYSADVVDRCLDKSHGMYSIITNRDRGEGIVIGCCPWCGVKLPTGI
ncbi:MAG: hypothetical protein JWP89_619 [Schlesneria sp.]|nr:hypothetical protein [Schlesneria sp.]